MQYINYPHLLLCSTALSLLVSHAYAVTSPVTAGPSVGHRPVTTGLNLGTGNGAGGGNITLATTLLVVGNTIGLLSASGNDADGDPDKAGANCVWYRVDPNTHAATVAKNPGPADRNCHYTLQAADVGFKIKNVIKIFSDQDIATAKGFTVNPIESWPVETLSANVIITTTTTTTKFNHMLINGWKTNFSTGGASSDYLSYIYEGATFQFALTSDHLPNPINETYNWSSSSPASVTVSNAGVVTFNSYPGRELTITATPKIPGAGATVSHKFDSLRWVLPAGPNKVEYTEIGKYCQDVGAKIFAGVLGNPQIRSFSGFVSTWGLSAFAAAPWNDVFHTYPQNNGPDGYFDFSNGSYEMAYPNTKKARALCQIW